MKPVCPYVLTHAKPTSDSRNIVRNGRFRRISDGRDIQRFICRDCGRHFSFATLKSCYRQKKRRLNHKVHEFMSSGLTQRRMAFLFHTTRKTIARKMKFVAEESRKKMERINEDAQLVVVMEFDDMETFEHTKMKPLSITVAVEYPSRRILGAEVSTMPARGPLAAKSVKKYGPRKDGRKEARQRLFARLAPHLAKAALIKSDQHPHYPKDVDFYFPNATHERFKSRRPIDNGHGELKEGWDELFCFNHTAAMIRHGMSRLVRRTWTTTKKLEGLADHLAIYSLFHNQALI